MSQALSEANESLTNIICELEAFVSLDKEYSSEESPLVESTLILARRISSTTCPPFFLRFNTESGPLEPLPARFHVPFPSLEDLRHSLMNSQPMLTPPTERKVDDEEYANDF